MWKDPIVEEIHKVREEIARECGYDPEKIFKRIQALEKKNSGRIAHKEDLRNAG
ncbi:MAG: hypothetical protein HYU64_15215 [Armatimonadetes bacterium]|nr:hypothetical protein [Armatimonadota bacterium]